MQKPSMRSITGGDFGLERTLHGPGPSDVPSSVLEAMSAPTVGHLDPVFTDIMDEIETGLKYLFLVGPDFEGKTLAMSGTGSSGMQTLAANLLEPGDNAVVGVNGVFGARTTDCMQRLGSKVITVERPWGSAIPVYQFLEQVRKHQPKVAFLVNAETSTGVWQKIDEIGAAIHDVSSETLFGVDCVTSLGGMEFRFSDWQIDFAFSGTQKCLSCPPALSPVCLSPRALQSIADRRTPVPSWYFDLSQILSYWGSDRKYHHTAPINSLYALHEALRLIIEEGLEARWARHRRNHEALKVGLTALGVGYVVADDICLPMLNAVGVPAGTKGHSNGVDDAAVRQKLLNEFGVEIGAGLGQFAGKVWRIGLMGDSSREEKVVKLIAQLEETFVALGHLPKRINAVETVREFYRSA